MCLVICRHLPRQTASQFEHHSEAKHPWFSGELIAGVRKPLTLRVRPRRGVAYLFLQHLFDLTDLLLNFAG